ncbi:SRPBCC family protein [Sphingomonas sp. CFBP 13720]|uniref:SRPBCC family protein n=1 Tax=Sphingomonas sp. CFBP 13720 TaxID=2775302 RepID=UPI001782E157|nr:SRPBCC family protein [Sphingomonas sp. CFBP 13720]MBD8676933.1 SRPBCC family protein [Sphingomonas sp. CFBP 13720]
MAEPTLPGDIVRDDSPAFTSKDKSERAEAAPNGESSVSGVAVTINRPRHELYAYWRDFANLATFMHNIRSIDVLDRNRSHWTVAGPNGDYEWDAVVTEDVDGERIGWKAENSDVANSGQVSFADAAPGRGTVVTAVIAYSPPAGIVGKVIAKVTQKEPAIEARRDLRRFKQLMETGEIATTTPPNREPKS